ncbi:unnamed protein product [Auanema sp. JU1783]|nr:unnamed protein product [Auanema sp. JU1783]
MITDKGVEFYNVHCQKLFKSLKIAHGSTNTVQKAAMVERANRTIKTRLSKYMYYKNEDRWIDVLADIVDGINNSFNRSIKMKPIDVTANIFIEDYTTVTKPKFKVGDTVRINKYRKTFEKSYDAGYTMEIFTIDQVLKGLPTVYKIKDYNGDLISGIFYDQELSLATNSSGQYFIEKILKRRTRSGVKEIFVKWSGYPDEFNEWIVQDNLVD